jgi:nitrogen-specific signal transduction histidine kinase
VPDSKTTIDAPEGAGVDADRSELETIFERQRKLCHNINNPLTAIMGRAQIVQLKEDSDPAMVKVVQVIEESAKRVAGYVRELSDLTHRGREIIAGK